MIFAIMTAFALLSCSDVWFRILSTVFALLVAPDPEIGFSFGLKLAVW